jgi:hypothetical protein
MHADPTVHPPLHVCVQRPNPAPAGGSPPQPLCMPGTKAAPLPGAVQEQTQNPEVDPVPEQTQNHQRDVPRCARQVTLCQEAIVPELRTAREPDAASTPAEKRAYAGYLARLQANSATQLACYL